MTDEAFPIRRRRNRTLDEARDALSRLIHGAWHKPDAKACFTIPVDEERDADCILMDVVFEWAELKAASAQAGRATPP